MAFETLRTSLFKAGYEPVPMGGYANGNKHAAIVFQDDEYVIKHLPSIQAAIQQVSDI
jgi:hypothetical protein